MRKLSAVNKFLSFFISLAVFFVFLPPHTQALAACDTSSTGITIGDCFVLNSKTGTLVQDYYKRPADLINLIVTNIYIIGGLILFVMVIYSGFMFIAEGEKGAEKAKTTLTTALMGFTIMFAAYWILRIIKIITGANIIF